MGSTPPFDANPRRMTSAMATGAPLPSANLRAPYRSETKSPETSKRLDDVMLQYQQQQKMLQHKPTYFSGGPVVSSSQQLQQQQQQQAQLQQQQQAQAQQQQAQQQQQQQQLASPTGYQDPYASHLGYTGTGGGRMLVRDNQQQQHQLQQQQQQQQLGGKYERKRVLADEPNPIEPSIADPLFSVKRTHFHTQPPPQTTTNAGVSSSRV